MKALLSPRVIFFETIVEIKIVSRGRQQNHRHHARPPKAGSAMVPELVEVKAEK